MEDILIYVGGFLALFGLYEIITHYKKRDLNLPGNPDPGPNRFAARRETTVALAQTNLDEQTEKRIIAANKVDQAPKRMKELDQATENQYFVTMNVLSKSLEMNLDSATYLEVSKKQNFDRLDIEKRWIEIEQDLKKIFIYGEKERQYSTLHKEAIFLLYEQRKLLEAGNELAKEDKLKFLDKWIKNEERVFNGRQKRLLQTSSRGNLRGGNENSDE